jgi:hypothetical protein
MHLSPFLFIQHCIIKPLSQALQTFTFHLSRYRRKGNACASQRTNATGSFFKESLNTINLRNAKMRRRCNKSVAN